MSRKDLSRITRKRAGAGAYFVISSAQIILRTGGLLELIKAHTVNHHYGKCNKRKLPSGIENVLCVIKVLILIA